jgi:thiol:disulfide interchange protein DsbC
MRKIILLYILSVSLVLSGYGVASAFPQGDQDCSKCHTLNNAEAQKKLSELIPDVHILDVRPSTVKGVWEIAAETGGRKIIVYLDYSGRHLIAGNLFSIQTKTNLTQNRIQEISRIEVSQIPLDNALLMGEKDAKYKVIVFDDPD